MADEKDLLASSSSASASLIQSSTAATKFGLVDVARASDKLNVVVLKGRLSDPRFANLFEIERSVQQFEQKVETIVKPETPAFKCKAEFDHCKQNSRDKSDQVICWMTFIVCLAERFVKVIEVKGGENA